MQTFKNLLRQASNLVFPPHIKCVFCEAELPQKNPIDTCEKCKSVLPYKKVRSLCQKCGDEVMGEGESCLVCKSTKRHFTKAVSCFFYKPPISSVVRKLKYNNAKYLATPLSNFLLQEYLAHNFDVDGVVFVPMTKSDEKKRGYNQAQLLAEGFCKLSNLPLVDESVLIKATQSKRQAELDLNQRHKNIAKSFKVTNKAFVKDRRLLLIDDVLTSGATASEISKTLLAAGASKVFVLTLARTHFPEN